MTVYGANGYRAEFVGMLRDRYLVRPIARFTEWDGDEYEQPIDAIETWDRIYRVPPVAVADEEIARLQAEIREAQKALLDTQREIGEATREHRETLKRLQGYAALKNLEPILAGEITHVVERSGWGVTIRTFAEASVYRDDYSRKDVMRMISLKPMEDGAIAWHLNRWCDGSGTDSPVYLCTSEEEAREAAQAAIVAPLQAYSYETHPHLWERALEVAEKLGLTLPDDITAKGIAHRISQAEGAVSKAADALRLAEEKRAALETPTPAESSEAPDLNSMEREP